ncbi:MAG: glycosyl hydrolase family 18 protein [Solirubrobacteraceae bacterium]
MRRSRDCLAACLLAALMFCCAGCGAAGRIAPQTIVIYVERSGHARSARVPAPVSSATLARMAVSTVTHDPGAPLADVAAWLPYWSMPTALASAVGSGGAVTTASPYWYTVSGDRTVIDQPGAGDAASIAALERQHIQIVPMVTESDGLRAFDRTLSSPTRRAQLVDTLIGIARDPAYSGLDLDFEQFALDPERSAALADEASDLYPKLVAEACTALHAIDRGCALTVMARTVGQQAFGGSSLASWVYDYAALGRAADQVQVMAYDYHYPDGAPGPIAPLWWVAQVIDYARASMPSTKVVLGIPAYGYDWANGGASAVPARAGVAVAGSHGVTPHWNAAQAEEEFSYRVGLTRHTVWYDDARADYLRAWLAASDRLGGVAIWAAGDEQPSVWPLLRTLEAGG